MAGHLLARTQMLPRSPAVTRLVSLLVGAIGCGTPYRLGETSARREVPTATEENAMVGSELGMGHYTEEGVEDRTPRSTCTIHPERERCWTCPKEGIGLLGSLSLQDYRAVVQTIKTFEPPPRPKPKPIVDEKTGEVIGYRSGGYYMLRLRWRKITRIRVVEPGHVEVNTMAPPKKGQCPHGDGVELRKEGGKWIVKRAWSWWA